MHSRCTNADTIFRIALLPSLVILAASMTWQAVASAEESPIASIAARPNIVFIFADDQRADTIAALGNPVIQTPHLDRLAKRGLSFRKAYMQGAMQGATCVPSRAMLLSGQNLFHADEKLLKAKTWPLAFAEAGYATFISGKWHNGDASLLRSFQTIESVFTGGMTNPMQASLRTLENGKLGKGKVTPKHACELFTDELIHFLRARNTPEHQSEPFFAYLPFDGPHDPHIVPDDFEIRYSPDDIPLPPNFMAEHPWDNGELVIRDELLLRRPRQAADIRQMLADYYRYISFLDLQIGRVLDELDRSAFASNTIVVFAADSGVARGSHGLIGKQNLYEHSIRVPLIVAGPEIPMDQQTNALCYLFDLLPTLGKRCGVASPNDSDGIDLNPVLANPVSPGRSQLIFAYRQVQQAITDGRWKFIRYPQVEKAQWFDLSNDPDEVNNRIDDPQFASAINDFTKRLEQGMIEAKGPAE